MMRCVLIQIIITQFQAVRWTNLGCMALAVLWLVLTSILQYTLEFGDISYLAIIPKVDTVISVLSNTLFLTIVEQLLR